MIFLTSIRCCLCKDIHYEFESRICLDLLLKSNCFILNDLLHYFTRAYESGPFSCSRCCEITSALKWTLLWKLPDILVIYFGRGQDSVEQGASKEKIITVPIARLDLKKYFSDSKN